MNFAVFFYCLLLNSNCNKDTKPPYETSTAWPQTTPPAPTSGYPPTKPPYETTTRPTTTTTNSPKPTIRQQDQNYKKLNEVIIRLFHYYLRK